MNTDEKKLLIAKFLDQLRLADQIDDRDNINVDNWIGWYDALLSDITNPEIIRSAMMIELMRRRGEALLALGRNDQHNRFIFRGESVKSHAGRESEARLIAKQYSVVVEYVKTEIAARRRPRINAALKLARDAQPPRQPKIPNPPVRRFAPPDTRLPPVDSTGTTKPNQRVHIWPAREEQLHDDSVLVSNLEARITTLGRPLEMVGSREDTFAIDLEIIKASIGRMLGYETGKYRGTDFVANAKRALQKIDSVIDRQIDWLIALRDFVRSAQPPATKASDEVNNGAGV